MDGGTGFSLWRLQIIYMYVCTCTPLCRYLYYVPIDGSNLHDNFFQFFWTY